MSKQSVLARQRKREHLVSVFAVRRKAMKEAGDYQGLDKLPKNASPVRLRNRCKLTGRQRGYIRMFGVSRLQFRRLALEGKIPGITKASW